MNKTSILVLSKITSMRSKTKILILTFVTSITLSGCSNNDISSSAYEKGNMADRGGSQTYRYDYEDEDYSSSYELEDDPDTTNDESNDQPVGFYGTDTMNACNQNSGNCYDLDVDSDGENIERLYFPKGGWVDIDDSDCDNGTCTATDENGTEWELEY